MKLPLTYAWQPSISKSPWLLIVLHGLGDSSEGFLWLQDELGIDSLNYLLLNAPDPYYTGYSWYDIDDPLAGIEDVGGLTYRLLCRRFRRAGKAKAGGHLPERVRRWLVGQPTASNADISS